MQFLTVSRRKSESFTDAEFAALAEDEFQRGRTMYSQGFLRQIWRRGDMPGACILWEADTEAQVRELVESLPFYKAGMLEITMVIPLHPYAGFGPR
jgi:muconolactone delta-isomerase